MWRLITLQYCIGFAIHWHESAMGVHVFPILNPPSHLLPHPIPQFSSVQSLSCVRLFVIPWITACQASLSITNSQGSLIYNLNPHFTKLLVIYEICHAYSKLITHAFTDVTSCLNRHEKENLSFHIFSQYSINLLYIYLLLDTENTNQKHICS